ncbi:flavin-containing monooxygenase [Haematomicrobium sanguinis]|uniref:flavin-containing monooxygenase n=1 Tax=Haematomicrobium sanguinis TaxID=479106 RepID=UPI000689ECAF|nr:NAD(P)/FAD-dependent oxidoreductase [Haematomicrobium sanguinis]
MRDLWRTIVIGAGQAGLSSAYFLVRAGLKPGVDFLVLDANPEPGGAWLHRWPSLTLGRAHNINDLPGTPFGTPDSTRPAAEVVSAYYRDFEQQHHLAVLRPVQVKSVEKHDGVFRISTSRGTFSASTVINATGTWDRPHWPSYPGMSTFSGPQIHTHDFHSVEDFAAQRVLVVGGGTSAVQFLLQFEAAGIDTLWSTRREPDWVDREFNHEWGREVEARVAERTLAGLPPESVIAATGLPLTDEYRAGIERGLLVSRGGIDHFDSHGVYFTDGSYEKIDAIVWATGFRAALGHLAPLKIRESGGGVLMQDGVRVAKMPGLYLVGYGPSASTLGATRAGRQAARAALEHSEVQGAMAVNSR